jgi:hypothetical protein
VPAARGGRAASSFRMAWMARSDAGGWSFSPPNAATGLKNRTLFRSPAALADVGNTAGGTHLGMACVLADVIIIASERCLFGSWNW